MYKKNLLILMAGILLLSACSQPQGKDGKNTRLARVGSHYLTLKEARTAIPDFVWRQDSIKALINYRKEWVNRRLLLRKAASLNIANSQPFQKRLQQARRRILTEAVREVVLAEFEKKHRVSDEEAMQFYKAHKKQFILNERYVRFRHLSTQSAEDARSARQALLSGGKWAAIAKKYSQHPKKRIRHSKKYWPASVVLNDLPALKQYIALLDSSEISPVRQINGTYHFIQLTGARSKGEYAKPAWVLGQIKRWMMLEKKNQFFNSYVKNLYLEAMEHNEIELYNVLKNSK